MTLDQFEEQLATTEQRLMNLTPVLTQIGNEMTAELKRNAPKGETGDLERSISLTVQPQAFGVIMLDYGAYQNYGVKGVGKAKYNNQVPSPFNNNKIYEFGTGSASKGGRPWGAYYSGLGPHVGWFDMDDISEEVTNRLQEAINNFFE